MGAELGEDGRVLVRPSGTEPVVRVLAEAQNAQDAEKMCASIAALVEREPDAGRRRAFRVPRRTI